MKKVFIGILFCLISFYMFGQTTLIFNAQGKLVGGSCLELNGDSMKVTDPATKNYYILDASHIYITAYDSIGIKLWKTDPYLDRMDRNMVEYTTKRPIIDHFEIKPWNIHSKKVDIIEISFDNHDFGYINLNTGKYTITGRD